MKKAIAIIVSVLFLFALTSLSFAAEEKKTAPAPAEKKEAAPVKAEEKKAPAKVKQLTGEVKAVDTKAMTITVTKKMKDKVVETVVTVDDKTNITCDKEKKALADVKVGDKVTVKYSEADGKNVAKSVAIKTEEKKMEKKAEPAKPTEKK
ncbi:MAG: hypothetical protein Q8P40_10760 [Nitrospirota bacterium]|nr:hypothetical protein [Nitrospirota bacterium]